VPSQSLLTLDGREQRFARSRECIKEAIAGGIDLSAVPRSEGFAQETALIGQDLLISVPELAQETRGTLDVGEQEGDGPRG
jgi:hypothetical protein